MKKLALLFLMLVMTNGCARTYPKLFDSPKFQEAVIKQMERSMKNVAATADVSNPEFEAGIKQAVYVRMIGVSAHIQGSGGDEGK